MTGEQMKEKFRKELWGLYVKNGVRISGCGCCNSPFVIELDDGDTWETLWSESLVDWDKVAEGVV